MLSVGVCVPIKVTFLTGSDGLGIWVQGVGENGEGLRVRGNRLCAGILVLWLWGSSVIYMRSRAGG